MSYEFGQSTVDNVKVSAFSIIARPVTIATVITMTNIHY